MNITIGSVRLGISQKITKYAEIFCFSLLICVLYTSLRVASRTDLTASVSPAKGFFPGVDWREWAPKSKTDDKHKNTERESVLIREFWKYNGASRRVWSVNCRSLLEGEPNEVEYARWLSNSHPSRARKPLPNSEWFKLTENCTDFKLRRGYFLKPLSDEEAAYPIAYSVLFYKDLQQVERVLRAIYMPQNIYCLHIDAYSSSILLLAAEALAKCFDNVFIASKLEKIVYAGFTRLQADINCMTDMLKHKHKWKYYINLASQAFPLKSNHEMVKVLRIYNGSNDIEGITHIPGNRIKKIWTTVTGRPRWRPRIEKTMKEKGPPPHKIRITKGSAYGIFSYDFVDFIINNRMARDLLEWSRETYSPDEHYWATLNDLITNPFLKTPGGYKGNVNIKPWLAAYASWGRESIDPCLSGHFVHGVCIFGLADLPALVARKEFFANKFHSNYEHLALDCLEEWLYNKTIRPPLFETFYYRRLPFINSPKLMQPPKPKKTDKPKIVPPKIELQKGKQKPVIKPKPNAHHFIGYNRAVYQHLPNIADSKGNAQEQKARS